LTKILFVATCLAVALGLWQGLEQLPWQFEPGERHPRWEGRYATLLPLLEGHEKAFFSDDRGTGENRQKLFRAQFVLGPTVLQERVSIDRIALKQLIRNPLILDYGNGPALSLVLKQLEIDATRQGLELSVERRPGALALVRTSRLVER